MPRRWQPGGTPWTADQSNTKGAALVIPLLPPRAQVRGVVKQPHTPERRLGALRTVKQNAPAAVLRTRNPPSAGPPPFNLTVLRSNSYPYKCCHSSDLEALGAPLPPGCAIAFFGDQMRPRNRIG